MNYIRKISVGSDYKNSMHYVTGQEVLNGQYVIHLIDHKGDSGSYVIYIEKDNEVFLWKEFVSSMPISIEYNINL